MAHAADKEQIEMLKTWWNDYGKIIAIAIIVGLAIGFGWRYWSAHKKSQSMHAAAIYQQLENAAISNDKTVVEKMLANLKSDFASTNYAAMGALLAVRLDVTRGDYTAAKNESQWVVDHNKSELLQAMAQINMARIDMQQNKNQAALDMLDKVKFKALLAVVEQTKGDVYMAMGHKALAKVAYQKAQSGYTDASINNNYINLLINQT